MNEPMTYFGRCHSLYHKLRSSGIQASDLSDPILEFSLLRLVKVGVSTGCPGDWETIKQEQLPLVKAVPEDVVGETTFLKWPVHLAAAWMLARGNRDYAEGVVSAVDRMIAEYPRNEDGLFCDPKYPGHLCTEIMAMTIPALVWTGYFSGDMRYYDEAIRQFEGYSAALYDENLGLWHPGYLPGKSHKEMWWVFPIYKLTQELYLEHTGLFPGCWGRGEGYALFALSELIYELPDAHPKKEGLLKIREQMLERLLQYQDANGLWHQVLNDVGSYPETSGSAWIIYAMGRGIKRGTIDRERFLLPYQRGLSGIAKYMAWDGSVFNTSMGCMCPGGRGTIADYALLDWKKDMKQGFAPLLLALQMAGQIEQHLHLIPSYQEVIDQFPGDR